MKRLVQSGKNFIRMILSFNEFTINLRNFFIECLGKTQGTRKKNALHSPPKKNAVLLARCPPVSPNHCLVDLTIAFIYECVCPPTFIYEYLCISIYVKYQGAMGFLTSNGIVDSQWNISYVLFFMYQNMHSTILRTRLR